MVHVHDLLHIWLRISGWEFLLMCCHLTLVWMLLLALAYQNLIFNGLRFSLLLEGCISFLNFRFFLKFDLSILFIWRRYRFHLIFIVDIWLGVIFPVVLLEILQRSEMRLMLVIPILLPPVDLLSLAIGLTECFEILLFCLLILVELHSV